METSIKLLRTPRPYIGESLKGLIIRVAEENGYNEPFFLLSLANVIVDSKTQKTSYTEQRMKNLSKMLNIDITTLKDMACLLGITELPPKAYNMFGHRVNIYSVRTTSPKVCPKCLRESNYARKIWDLAAFTCCPKHKTLLIEECPECKRKISWNRERVNICKCGCDWRYVVLPEIPESEMTLSKIILKVCGLLEPGEYTAEGGNSEYIKNNPLSFVGLSELICAVYFIAGQQHGVVDATGKHYAVNLSHRQLHEALTNSVMVFDNWPENYFKFLDECKGKNPNSERNSKRNCGLYKDFGKLYDPLFIRKNNPLPDFMREAFKQYITTIWDGGYAGWCGSISKEELINKKYMTRYEAIKHLKVSLITANRLYKQGYLKGLYLPWENRSRIMIEADSVRELKDRWNKSINAIKAGEMLGIRRIAVVSLVKSGCLAALQGPAVTGQLEWKFELSALEELLDLLDRKIPMEKTETITPHVSFHKAIQKLSKLSLDVGALVKLILDNKITPIAKGDGIGLSSLLFNALEIKQFLSDEMILRRGDKYTLSEAVKLLHTSNDEAGFLIKRGLLFVEKAAGGRVGTWAIAHDEIIRFNNTYSTLAYLSHALATSSKGMSARLMANGIMPVTGPKIDGGGIYFFRKADLEAVDFSKILPNIKDSTLDKMNKKGLISKKQLADISGYTIGWINKVLEKGWIVPAMAHQHKDGDTSSFFSYKQVQKFKELMAKEKHKPVLFDNKQTDKRLAP